MAGLAAEPVEAGCRHGTVHRSARPGPASRRRTQADRHQRSRKPARWFALHRRYLEGVAPPLSTMAFCLADGCRQPRAAAPLGAVERDLSDGPNCRVRPPFPFSEGARRSARQTLCQAPRADFGGAPAGGDEAAGLGVLPHPARYELGDPDPFRAPRNTVPDFHGAQTRIVHDHHPEPPHPAEATPTDRFTVYSSNSSSGHSRMARPRTSSRSSSPVRRRSPIRW